jgi:EAL domain-containing protein (putative c-di-GMP-specific phosphodiesterase class I)
MGHAVCHFGESGDSAYVIEAGSVEVLTAATQCVAVLGVGELFGEIALLDEKPRTATVRTLEPTTLLRIDRSYVQELLKRSDPVVRYLLTLLLQRFRTISPGAESSATAVCRLPLEDEAAATYTLRLTQDLAHALENRQLELAYQPLIDFAERRLVGFEALIRWNHPVLGTIMPEKLIGLAEKTGLIYPVGSWVLKQAITDWAILRQYCLPATEGFPLMSVNLSPAELASHGIVDTIYSQLAEAGMEPHELQVELTETVVIEDKQTVMAIMEKLSIQGVYIALDDFGTGHANLDYLKTLPISCLKIDQSFVKDMTTSPRSRDIVETTIHLAKATGLSTIGEGVEDEETALLLARMGCDIAQGYYFARPMPLGAIPGWLKDARMLGRLAGGE